MVRLLGLRVGLGGMEEIGLKLKDSDRVKRGRGMIKRGKGKVWVKRGV